MQAGIVLASHICRIKKGQIISPSSSKTILIIHNAAFLTFLQYRNERSKKQQENNVHLYKWFTYVTIYLCRTTGPFPHPFRSSSPEVSCKKGVLRNFTKFTGKHLCQSLFFNEVTGLRPAILLKKRLWHRCFPMNFVKFSRTPFYVGHLWRLLLPLENIKETEVSEGIEKHQWHEMDYKK